MDNAIATLNNGTDFSALERFTKIINEKPPATSLQKTPDGKADTMGISFVETKLDEIYLRQWGTEDVNVMQLGNEVLVWLTLWVIDPQTKLKITRPGFAAVVITVDKVPEDIAKNPKAKNAWALDMSNKKPNAMYLAFPKAKSLALKNAAQTLGDAFGRNLNRKHEDSPEDFYTNMAEGLATLTTAKKDIKAAETVEAFKEIWDKYPELHDVEEFKKDFMFYKRIISIKK